jgi:hypothetical protein
MNESKKPFVKFAIAIAIVAVLVAAGYAVSNAKASFSIPFFSNLQTNSADVPELGVVELKGTVDAIAADSYTVSGLTFRFDTLTIISGAPAVGDSVEVKGLTLPDLTRYALKIEKLDTVVTAPEFEFVGLVETMAANLWTVSNEQVQVDLTTVIDSGIAAGALVEVKGTVVAGQMLADTIELKENLPGSVGTEVELFGTVESITGTVYMIGGKTVNTDGLTELVGTIVVGNFVKVHASLNADGTYLAREIELISGAEVTPTPGTGDDDDQGEDQDDQGEDEDEQEIKVSGVLESMAAGLWVVDGVSFVVDDSTKIEGDPQVGDVVKIEGKVQSDGTNLAHEIELEEDESIGDDDSSGSDDDSGNSGSDDDSDDDDAGGDDDDNGGSGGGDDDHDESEDTGFNSFNFLS